MQNKTYPIKDTDTMCSIIMAALSGSYLDNSITINNSNLDTKLKINPKYIYKTTSQYDMMYSYMINIGEIIILRTANFG